MLLAGPDTLPLSLVSLDPGIELVAASRGTSEGLTITDGPQLILKLFVEAGPVRIGGQWKNVSSPVANGVMAMFASTSRTVGKAQIGLRVGFRIQTRASRSSDPTAWEFSATAARKFGRITGRFTVNYSPDDLGPTKQALFIEGGPALDLDSSTILSANFGWRWRRASPDYGAFNIGISKKVTPQLTVDVRAHGTTRGRLGRPYRPVALLSARLGI